MVKPFVKWPGGKTAELEIIHQYMPRSINNYIEPFLGGGACFFSLDKDRYQQAFVNDFSDELISLYLFIKDRNELFRSYLLDIWELWCYFGTFSDRHYEVLRDLYGRYKSEQVTKEQLKEEVSEFVEGNFDDILCVVPHSLNLNSHRLIRELKTSIASKMTNTKNNEGKKGDLPEEDYRKNFEASIRASIYTYYRFLYNQREQYQINREMHIALFFYLREFCYSSMFRYNQSGGFNVPYGGASYNSKAFINKIEYLWTNELHNVLQNASIFNLDFEHFFEAIPLHEDDFIFLDPPYDSDFSTYANHSFASDDQIRLADFLLNRCGSKFMVIIKNTDFIYQLYNQPGINIIGFDKSYSVSFMDRNDKKVEHIIITNYEVGH
ncbi:DNA adenine methylase [Anaerobacillus alkalidiazotrophicus]|uniref:DNA adenine methylase n=1 Tax=Anaerobacillus alkalidiazotrophicus TaxID=472963 RepID=UPI000A04E90B|nr:DNA adenine methylase [Anaerobacillus alkalidiazotrophicus]